MRDTFTISSGGQIPRPSESESPQVLLPTGRGNRPYAQGKFVYIGSSKLYVRGVTYGPFRPEPDGSEYHDAESVNHDFAQMAAHGINAVRTYTVPPRWLLDCAQRHGLWVMVGLPWEQHVAFLRDWRLARRILRQVREGVRACAGHPAVLCYAIGNEVPSSIVRWHGHQRVERHIESLYHAAKAEDPEALVAYVNYPSTEYLHLPFVDLVCFNVYLERPSLLAAYLARLQNLAGDRPLLLTEIGLDSRHHGLQTQADSLQWQVQTAFAGGVAGLFAFAWTDEWHRGGYDVEDWDFGLTDRDRRPKPALASVTSAFSQVPFPASRRWPRISVVVATYNGARVIGDCLESLERLEYPNYEVIVVNDGSRDSTSEIVRQHSVHLIEGPNRGLSAARNSGMEAATGEIVAYVDDDVCVDPNWLHYLAQAFTNDGFAAVGGPNIPPPDAGLVAECVANSPGEPVHVLLADQIAEHIPGCNMAFRKSVLEAVGGFDPQFRAAGDDVDICWRLHAAGHKIGFHGAAMVWHHRRNSVRAYWNQQVGYGRAEALLEKKWPEKYNAAGQPRWFGRLYGNGGTHVLSWSRTRIYHGTWGGALFQSIYEPAPSNFWSLARMPEWYLLVFALAVLSVLGLFWWPLHAALPVLIVACAPSLVQAGLCATRAKFDKKRHSVLELLAMGVLTAGLHLLQPLARLIGRRSKDLRPTRRDYRAGLALPGPRTVSIWSESWRAPHAWFLSVETALKAAGFAVIRGGNFDRWDLQVRGGALGAVRLRMAIEEHGGGRQLVHARLWPRVSRFWFLLCVSCSVVAVGAAIDYAKLASAIFAGGVVLYWLVLIEEWARTTGVLMRVLRNIKERSEKTERPAGNLPHVQTARTPPPTVVAEISLEVTRATDKLVHPS